MTPLPDQAEQVRAFVAAPLADEALDYLRRVQTRLQRHGGDVHWIAPCNLHLTLVFLGEIPPTIIAPLTTALDQVATNFQPLTLGIGGVSSFGAHGRPRVIWAGLTGQIAALARLAGAVRAAAERYDIRVDDRQFVPHITLGRTRRGRRSPQWATALSQPLNWPAPEFRVQEICLIRSRLTSQGATYSLLHSSPLAAL